MKKRKLKTFDDIRFEIEQLAFEEDRLLRENGWEWTCNTPGSIWLWKKKFKGLGVILVEKKTAIYLARNE